MTICADCLAELATGIPIVYKIDDNGKVLEKKILE